MGRRLTRMLWAGAVVVLASHAHAGDFSVGVWAGPNVASLQIEGSPASERESRLAPAVGGVLAWRPGDAWSVELRPSFVGRGAKVLVEGTQARIEARYLELPLLVTRELASGGVRPYLLAGAALGRRGSATAKLGSIEMDIGPDFERWDASLRFGAGIRGGHGSAQPFLEVEYARGLEDLNTTPSGLGADVGAIRNRGVQVRAGICFGSRNR